MDPKISQPQLVQLVHDRPALDPTIIPNPPRPGDAFKRACRYSERTNLPIPASPNTANVMIRSVKNTSTEIDRHMVLEIVDPEGKHLSYDTVAEFNYNRPKDELQTTFRFTGHPDYDAIVRASVDLFKAQIRHATNFLDAQSIRRMIRDQLERMSAISVRRQGSVYFYPATKRDQGDALQSLCQAFNSGSSFHHLPLINTENQREMIKNAFEEEVHEETMQMVGELRRYMEEERVITDGAWAEYRKRQNILMARAKEYQALVDFEVSKAETELEMLKTSIDDFLLNGMVKLTP